MHLRQPSLDGGHENVVQTQFQRNPSFGSGVGYQLMAESTNRQVAQAQWQADHVVFNGSLFGSRHIAVVDVGGYEGVRVTQDNQVVARTDVRGRAFVSGLRSDQSNCVGIDPADQPMDAGLQAMEIQLTPAARSAACIEFPVPRCRPLPPDALPQTAGQPRQFPVGPNGRTYLVGLNPGRNTVQARWAGEGDNQCQFEFPLPPTRDGDDLPDLGILICR